METKPFVIDVHELCKSFDGKPAVINVTLQVKKGEVFGFLGPNGSGKTTTIRMLCGLLTPNSGSGTCLDKNILTESLDIKHQVGYMTQHFGLYKDLSVYENLDFIARLYQIPNRKNTIQETIEQFDLTEFTKQLAGNLSGGWQQRLALASALLHKPKLLLLDEPTIGIDPKARRDFWGHIHRLSSEEEITTLISTHYMDEAEQCHRLAYILKGEILVYGTSEEIISSTGLTTWKATGGNLIELQEQLKMVCNHNEQIAIFGNSLHFSGKNAEELEEYVKKFQKEPYRWELIKATLDDVFINLVSTQHE